MHVGKFFEQVVSPPPPPNFNLEYALDLCNVTDNPAY